MLFDGVPQKIYTEGISETNSKKFFYYIDENAMNYDLTIFLSSETNSKYQISSKVMTMDDFAKDIQGNLYPTFNEENA